MEEWVGQWWHRAITRAADRNHPQAAVRLEEVQRAIGLLFRAAGGDAALRIAPAGARKVGGPRDWLQRIAGSGQRAACSGLGADTLSLPPELAVFDDAALNRDLYLWLAALAASYAQIDITGHWITDNQAATARTLQHFTGLRSRYARLVQASLALRPQANRLRGGAAADEAAVQAALRATLKPGLQVGLQPGLQPAVPCPQPSMPGGAFCEEGAPTSVTSTSGLTSAAAPSPRHVLPQHVAPVWLWLQLEADLAAASARARNAADAATGQDPQTPGPVQDPTRRRAQAVVEEKNGAPFMLFFRAESLLSWSELVKVNRATDDEDDGHALAAANDMDQLSVSPDGAACASRVKFDLDLPSAAADDLPVGPGLWLPEWDWRRQRLLPAHCAAQTLLARPGAAWQPPAALRRTAGQVRQRLELLRAQPHWLRAQEDGQAIDLDAWVRHRTHGNAARSATPAVYARRVPHQRSLATLLMADLSLSTDAHVNNEQRVIDVIRDTLFVFGEALSATGDAFAMLGFSSVRRQHVRIQHLLGFDQPWDAAARSRVGAVKPGFYTRMGAAIRVATLQLAQRPERQRLLLLLTDGKPNDLDVYEGRYGLEDTRHAILEARAAGLTPFCVSIDERAQDYLPALFGRQGYAHVRRPAELPLKLAAIYSRLSRSAT